MGLPVVIRAAAAFACAASATTGVVDFKLVQSIIVSRHGIRTPYPPTNGTVTDFSSYTYKSFPDNTTWGMAYDPFSKQELTPHGEYIVPFVGAYYRESLADDGLEFLSCDNIVCFADESTRDIQTANLWLQGFGCPNVEVRAVTESTYSSMQPVLSDHYYFEACPLANEEQVNGLFGGNVDALTNMYSDEIDLVNEVLDMRNYDASICRNINPTFDNVETCTLFETGYEFTGLYYQGMFTSPFYYAQYFAEAWMLQYLSNLTDWGFGMLSLADLTDLNVMHYESLQFGANHWNSLSYSSQQLAYIVATMEQLVTDISLEGVEQSKDTKLLLLASHDMNVLYLRELLDISWVPFGYSDGIATTTGALVFDLFQSSDDDSYFVKVHYDAATPTQQRNAEQLSLENPPSVADIVIPLCGKLMCPWETFREVALTAINSDCILEPLQSTVKDMSTSSTNGRSDNDKNGYEDYKVILVTAAVCIAIFGLVVGCVAYWRIRTESLEKHAVMSSASNNIY